MKDFNFENLKNYLQKAPAIKTPVSHGIFESNFWWVKFQIDIENPLAWRVVQEIGHVANYLSLNEKLPTVFYPVSPPPYLNGGPSEFLSWVIESTSSEFSPDDFQEWLEGRLPKPVEDLEEWRIDDEE